MRPILLWWLASCLRLTAITRETVVESDDIPADLRPVAEERRRMLIEAVADVDEEMAECFLDEQEPTIEQLKLAIRRATISLRFTPVFVGSALADTAVQPLLDGVCDYLPNPAEVVNMALDRRRAEAPVKLVSYSSLPFVGLAFKLEESNFGQLTYIRVYQGSIRKGAFLFNARTGKKVKIPKIVRMHSNEMEEVPEIGAGEICAVFGVDCASGDTFTDGNLAYSMVRRSCFLLVALSTHTFPDVHVRARPRHLPIYQAEEHRRYGPVLEGYESVSKGRPYIPCSRRPRKSGDHHLRHGRAPSRYLRGTNATRI